MYKLNIIIIIISRSRHVNVHWSDYILLVKLVFFCWVLLQHAADDIAEKGLLSGLLAAKSLSQIPRERAACTDNKTITIHSWSGIIMCFSVDAIHAMSANLLMTSVHLECTSEWVNEWVSARNEEESGTQSACGESKENPGMPNQPSSSPCPWYPFPFRNHYPMSLRTPSGPTSW